MKTAFATLVIVVALITGYDARAEEYSGACVWPTVNPRAILVYETPAPIQGSGKYNALAYLPYKAEIRSGHYIALWSVPETLNDSSQFLGWVDQSEFEVQHPRNCTF